MADGPIRIHPTFIGRFWRDSERDAVMTEELRAYLTASTKMLEAEVAKRIPVNSGVTRGALFSAVRGITQGRGEAVVSLPVEHADALEMGSKPHWPPRAPIELWVRQRFRDKLGSIRVAVKSMKKAAGSSQERAIRSLAFLVARAISRRGTKAHHMFSEAERIFKPAIIGSMYDAMVEKIAKRLGEN